MRPTILASTVVLLTSLVSSLQAAQLDPAQLPADAKWVVHIDLDKFRDTTLAAQVRQTLDQELQALQQWLQKRYGVDLKKDVHGFTMFSDTYEAHSGAILLHAKYDAAKLQSLLQDNPRVEQSNWQEYTLYSWPMADRSQQAERREAAAGKDRLVMALVKEKHLVFAGNQERVQAVIQLLQGDRESLKGQSSSLTQNVPNDAIFYGAAIDLKQLSQREKPFPVLQQHKQIVWSIGERDGRVFEQARLEANSDQVAQKVQELLEGLTALADLWAADNEQLSQVIQQVEISRKANTVEVQWSADAQTVLAALQQAKQQWPGIQASWQRMASNPSQRTPYPASAHAGERTDPSQLTAIQGTALLGISVAKPLDAEVAQVTEVVPDGPAARAGIQVGDTIVSVGDREIHSPEAFRSVISQQQPGATVAVIVKRGDQKKSVQVQLAEPKQIGTAPSDIRR